MSANDPLERARNRRPVNVTSFLYEGEVYDEWFFANRSANRFYIVNLERVISLLNIKPTLIIRADFDEAERIAAKETAWPDQYGFEYKSSRTQLYGEKIYSAKQFGLAATIIVAMEVIAKKINAEINVYDYLRIIPAHYFVDEFDEEKLKALSQFHDAMDAAQKEKVFGAEHASKTFEEACLQAIGQSFNKRLLAELATGGCVTKFVAEHVIKFIKEHYPPEMHVQYIRGAGQQSISTGLGRKKAIDKMEVPRRRDPGKLPPCA